MSWKDFVCGFIMRDLKNNVCSNSPDRPDIIKHNICERSIPVEVSEFRLLSNNLLKRPEISCKI
jgi:hypothetical protein